MTQQTPFTQVSISLHLPGDGTVGVQVGNLTQYVPVSLIKDVWSGRSDQTMLIWLLCQMALVLQQAGVNPETATPAQMASAIEAQKYWV